MCSGRRCGQPDGDHRHFAATGVTIDLARGKPTGLFNRDAAPGSITLNGTTTALAATVDALPEGHL